MPILRLVAQNDRNPTGFQSGKSDVLRFAARRFSGHRIVLNYAEGSEALLLTNHFSPITRYLLWVLSSPTLPYLPHTASSSDRLRSSLPAHRSLPALCAQPSLCRDRPTVA